MIDGRMGCGCFTSRCKGAELFRTSSTLDRGGEGGEGRGKEERKEEERKGKGRREEEGREEEEKRGEEERESSKKASNEQQQQEWKQEAGSSDDRTHSGEVGEIVVGKKKGSGSGHTERQYCSGREERKGGDKRQQPPTIHPARLGAKVDETSTVVLACSCLAQSREEGGGGVWHRIFCIFFVLHACKLYVCPACNY